MRPDMIWGNDEKYTKEFQIKCREEQQKRPNELMERIAKEESERASKEQIIGSALRKSEAEAQAKGEIRDVFIKQHLEAKIITARWALALGMAATFLFKGQWLIWIAFIIIYFLYINGIKADAIEADKRRKDFGKRK